VAIEPDFAGLGFEETGLYPLTSTAHTVEQAQESWSDGDNNENSNRTWWRQTAIKLKMEETFRSSGNPGTAWILQYVQSDRSRVMPAGACCPHQTAKSRLHLGISCI
jgi:hypothetical protein